MERRRVKSMLVVDIVSEITVNMLSVMLVEYYWAVDVGCDEFKLPVYIHLAPTTVPCLSRDLATNVSHDHCVANLGNPRNITVPFLGVGHAGPRQPRKFLVSQGCG
jgi:hypothetical protein